MRLRQVRRHLLGPDLVPRRRLQPVVRLRCEVRHRRVVRARELHVVLVRYGPGLLVDDAADLRYLPVALRGGPTTAFRGTWGAMRMLAAVVVVGSLFVVGCAAD